MILLKKFIFRGSKASDTIGWRFCFAETGCCCIVIENNQEQKCVSPEMRIWVLARKNLIMTYGSNSVAR